MIYKYIGVAAAVAALAACSTLGRLTAKDYTSNSGQRVLVAQAEPESGYACSELGQETHDWGFSQRSNQGAAMEKLRQDAADEAASKGANYAYVDIPSDSSVMGFNVNAFKDATVTYYKCASLPPASA
ncbi:MAG TPA: hypothetical protein VFL54_07490 [Gammaproteobacteria bacterium]|jgi:hypothetical protein|nr:hypothetical protein [Gammaproteobacteria bacterium]